MGNIRTKWVVIVLLQYENDYSYKIKDFIKAKAHFMPGKFPVCS